MAIPFYNDEEENEEPQEAVLPEVVQEEIVQEEKRCSFLEQLVQELLGVFCTRFGQSSPSSVSSVGASVGASSSSSDRRRNRYHGPSAQLQHPLPDLVCCHVQALRPPILQEHELSTPERSLPPPPLPPRPVPRPIPSLPQPRDQNDMDSDPSGLSLDIKMSIDYTYQRIGRDLRHIADQYENHHSQRRRRRHPAGNQQPSSLSDQTTIKFEFALKVVIPVTLVGLSLAFLKRNSG